MTRPLVLVDLDDTLFQSRRKCPAVEAGHLGLAAEASNGRHSYATRAQGNLFAWLSQTAEVVPVTARGSEAYARVRLPFRHGAVLANGAVILLPDGLEDASWRAEVAGALAGVGGDLERLLDRGRRLAHDAGLRLRSWIVREGGLGAYAVFKDDADEDGAGLAALAGALDAAYWKPVQSGLEDETDSAAVQRLSGLPADRILPERYRLKTPASPHLAAAIDGVSIDVDALDPPPTPRPPTGRPARGRPGGSSAPSPSRTRRTTSSRCRRGPSSAGRWSSLRMCP